MDEFVPDSGMVDGRPDGAIVAEDAGDLDASDGDVLVPNDADRSDYGGQCTENEHCVVWVEAGPCERAVCEKGHCIKVPLPDGTSCDDGNACTIGDSCKSGICSFDHHSPGQPGCARDPEPGVIWFSEIMGKPRSVPNVVDPVDGQWIEIVNRGKSPVRLGSLKLVYYEWPDGAEEPSNPTPVIYQLTAEVTDDIFPTLMLRTQDSAKTGIFPTRWTYSKIEFDGSKNSRLLLVKSEWTGTFPIALGLVIDNVELKAGSFADGRSWQLGWPLPENPIDRSWCHAPVSEPEYATSNYGSPGQPNFGCL